MNVDTMIVEYKFNPYIAQSILIRIWAKIVPYWMSKNKIPIFNYNINDLLNIHFYLISIEFQ